MVSEQVRGYCFACWQVKGLLMLVRGSLGELHGYKFNPSTAHQSLRSLTAVLVPRFLTCTTYAPHGSCPGAQCNEIAACLRRSGPHSVRRHVRPHARAYKRRERNRLKLTAHTAGRKQQRTRAPTAGITPRLGPNVSG
jgi:hypothetical protein